jgi:uncharacterized protein
MALSDGEFETLSDLLDAHSPFDFDGLLGLLHAVVLAPSPLQPSVWLPVLLPEGLGDLDDDTVKEFIGLVMRQYNDVVDGLARSSATMPMAEDVEGCESFAAGYVAGAELDPAWIGNDDRWTFAAPLAYLAGRLDLVPATMLEDILRHLEPDPKELVRQQMGGLIAATNESFEKHRRASLSQRPRLTPGRVGRNEPCPCGSGKKYKRCCVGRSDSPT